MSIILNFHDEHDIGALNNKNIVFVYIHLFIYVLLFSQWQLLYNDLLGKKWDRCLIAKVVYRDIPGGDDCKSWILHSDFKCISIKL